MTWSGIPVADHCLNEQNTISEVTVYLQAGSSEFRSQGGRGHDHFLPTTSRPRRLVSNGWTLATRARPQKRKCDSSPTCRAKIFCRLMLRHIIGLGGPAFCQHHKVSAGSVFSPSTISWFIVRSSPVYADLSLPGFNVLWTCRYMPGFRRNTLPSALKMAVCFPRNVDICLQDHTALQRRRSDKLKSHFHV
jgi:hypothetical protein